MATLHPRPTGMVIDLRGPFTITTMGVHIMVIRQAGVAGVFMRGPEGGTPDMGAGVTTLRCPAEMRGAKGGGNTTRKQIVLEKKD